MLIEMPVLDDALTAVAAIFTPSCRLRSAAVLRLASQLTSMVPRTHYLIDIASTGSASSLGPHFRCSRAC